MAAAVLPYNTTSINASFPVGHGIVNALLVIAFVVFNYIFVCTTLMTILKGNKAKWASTNYFVGFDVAFFGFVLWGAAACTIFIYGLTEYKNQLTVNSFSLYNPQDVSNIVEATVCLWLLFLWKFALFYDVYLGGAKDTGVVENKDNYRFTRNAFFTTWTWLTLLFLCIWPAAYGFVQNYQNYSRIEYTNQNGWFAPFSSFNAVGAGNLATGILLVVSIVVYFSGNFTHQLYSKLKIKAGYTELNVKVEPAYWETLFNSSVSYESKLFSGVEGFNTTALVKGWIPAYHLPTSFVLAFCFFTGSSNMFTKYDLIKTNEFFCCVCLVPLVLCALSQTLDYFIAYHVAARFWFIAMQYFAGAILTNYLSLVDGTGYQGATGKNLDFGMYLSGPGNDSGTSGLIDPTTVQFQTWFALSLAVISFAFSAWGGEKNKT